MKIASTFLAICLLAALPSSIGFAQQPAAAIPASPDLTNGEIRKVDKDSKKITIKHGEIKNLDMPAMTMVFQVKDAAMLDKIQVGDKVTFKVEKQLGAFVVTELQLAK